MLADYWKTQRILANYDSGREGPLLILTVGIHGNEPAGGNRRI